MLPGFSEKDPAAQFHPPPTKLPVLSANSVAPLPYRHPCRPFQSTVIEILYIHFSPHLITIWLSASAQSRVEWEKCVCTGPYDKPGTSPETNKKKTLGGVSREYPPAKKEAFGTSSLCFLSALLGKKATAQCPSLWATCPTMLWFLPTNICFAAIWAFFAPCHLLRMLPNSCLLHSPKMLSSRFVQPLMAHTKIPVVFGDCFWIL